MLEIILDHDAFVVVNKPAGIAVHGDQRGTVLEQVREHFGNCNLHPVHRLDRETSGLLIFAKTELANATLCQAFAKRQVEKIYLALTTGKIKKKCGWVKGDMQKARSGSYKLMHSCQNPAITYGISFGHQQEPRIWILRPVTGKTHQLRVALKALGAGILGDSRYGGDKADRMYLHAFSMRFRYFDERFLVTSRPSRGQFFETLLESDRLAQIGDPWDLDWPKEFSRDKVSKSGN
jgi:tRNA pseudouridine32 synthase/23S rRNA pseudouridine746 synthase